MLPPIVFLSVDLSSPLGENGNKVKLGERTIDADSSINDYLTLHGRDFGARRQLRMHENRSG